MADPKAIASGYLPGDLVEVMCHDDGRWHLAEVRADQGDGTYTVAWLDAVGRPVPASGNGGLVGPSLSRCSLGAMRPPTQLRGANASAGVPEGIFGTASEAARRLPPLASRVHSSRAQNMAGEIQSIEERCAFLEKQNAWLRPKLLRSNTQLVAKVFSSSTRGCTRQAFNSWQMALQERSLQRQFASLDNCQQTAKEIEGLVAAGQQARSATEGARNATERALQQVKLDNENLEQEVAEQTSRIQVLERRLSEAEQKIAVRRQEALSLLGKTDEYERKKKDLERRAREGMSSPNLIGALRGAPTPPRALRAVQTPLQNRAHLLVTPPLMLGAPPVLQLAPSRSPSPPLQPLAPADTEVSPPQSRWSGEGGEQRLGAWMRRVETADDAGSPTAPPAASAAFPMQLAAGPPSSPATRVDRPVCPPSPPMPGMRPLLGPPLDGHAPSSPGLHAAPLTVPLQMGLPILAPPVLPGPRLFCSDC